MRTPRTYLFVPGNRPDRFDKALASGADAVVLDLEDAVSDDAKDTARTAVGRWAAMSGALDWAHRVLAADRASPGAARLAGGMIDRPVVLTARRTVTRAGLPGRNAGPTPERRSSTSTTSNAHSAAR